MIMDGLKFLDKILHFSSKYGLWVRDVPKPHCILYVGMVVPNGRAKAKLRLQLLAELSRCCIGLCVRPKLPENLNISSC